MTSQISSLTGLTLIDTTNTSGSINLPQISGQVGRILTFKDSNNNFANSINQYKSFIENLMGKNVLQNGGEPKSISFLNIIL